MKIAFVTGWGVMPHNGGQGTFCAQLISSLATRGHAVSVLSRNVSTWAAWANSVGIRDRIEIRKPSAAHLVKADVVHLNGPAVRMLAWTSLLQLPTVVTHEDYHLYCPEGSGWHPDGCTVSADQPELCARCRNGSTLSRVHLRVQARLARRTGSVAVSEHVKKRLRLSETVLHPFDVSALPDLSSAPVERRVAFIGRLVPEKGPQVAIAALSHLPGVMLDIYGQGAMRSALEIQVRDSHVADRVRFMGLQASPVIKAASAAAILVPGLWDEPLGYVTIEAMAAGKAVIATALGGSLELLGGERGWLVPPDDSQSLASAIECVLADPSERVRRGLLAREFIGVALDPQHVAERYEDIYRRQITGQPV